MGIRRGKASVAAGAAAASAPSGPDCGGDRRWRGAGNSGGGGGERGDAEEGRSWSAKAGGGEVGGGGFGAGRSCRGGSRELEEAKEVSECGRPRKLYPGSGTGAASHLGGPLCPSLCQPPTLDVFILAAPTGSAPSAQWEALPAQ